MNAAVCDGDGKDCKMAFHFVEGNVTLDVREIHYIETNKHKNFFYTNVNTYSIYKKIGELEEELSGYDFLRIHQSFLVNMRYIQKISSYILTLTTGEQLSVPKARYREVKRRYQDYLEKNQIDLK